MIFVGWDGGGTKTEVCLTDEAGRLLARESFGPLNPNGADRSRMEKTVGDALRFMADHGVTGETCGGFVIGMAGISNHAAAGWLREALARAGWQGPLTLAGDQQIALAGAIEGHGAILIAGTGSVCFGRTPAGETFRVGGYGHLIDDVGSGYAIGREILMAAVRAEDGRAAPTLLRDRLYAEMGFTAAEDLVTWLYAPGREKREIAALARLLPEALEQRDPAAEGIAERAGEDLADLAVTAWRKSGMTDGELAMTGSILLHVSAIRGRVAARMREAYPEVCLMHPRGTPAEGAAKMAREPEGGSGAEGGLGGDRKAPQNSLEEIKL